MRLLFLLVMLLLSLFIDIRSVLGSVSTSGLVATSCGYDVCVERLEYSDDLLYCEAIFGIDSYFLDLCLEYVLQSCGGRVVPESEIPEFTSLGAGLILLGAGVIAVKKRRRN